MLDDEDQRRIRAYAWAPADVLDTTFDESYAVGPINVGTFTSRVALGLSVAVAPVIGSADEILLLESVAPVLDTEGKTIRILMLKGMAPEFDTEDGILLLRVWLQSLTPKTRS